MEKLTVVCLYTVEYYSAIKSIELSIYNDMHESQSNDTEWKKPQNEVQLIFVHKN